MNTDINVIGFGLMGRQISSLLFLLGCNVNLYNKSSIDSDMFFRQVKLLKRGFEQTQEGSVTFYDELSALPNNITIESVTESLEIKKNIYSEVRKNNDKFYFSNTSSYSPCEIGEDVKGFHFFNPISIGLIELNINESDLTEELIILIDKFKVFNFEIVNVNNNRGYIGNYILFHEISSALKLIEKFNYSVEKINCVYSKLYNKRDVFFIIDLIGIDVVFNILTNLKENDETIYMPNVLKIAIDRNILGRKNKTSIKSLLHEL